MELKNGKIFYELYRHVPCFEEPISPKKHIQEANLKKKT